MFCLKNLAIDDQLSLSVLNPRLRVLFSALFDFDKKTDKTIASIKKIFKTEDLSDTEAQVIANSFSNSDLTKGRRAFLSYILQSFVKGKGRLTEEEILNLRKIIGNINQTKFFLADYAAEKRFTKDSLVSKNLVSIVHLVNPRDKTDIEIPTRFLRTLLNGSPVLEDQDMHIHYQEYFDTGRDDGMWRYGSYLKYGFKYDYFFLSYEPPKDWYRSL